MKNAGMIPNFVRWLGGAPAAEETADAFRLFLLLEPVSLTFSGILFVCLMWLAARCRSRNSLPPQPRAASGRAWRGVIADAVIGCLAQALLTFLANLILGALVGGDSAQINTALALALGMAIRRLFA